MSVNNLSGAEIGQLVYLVRLTASVVLEHGTRGSWFRRVRALISAGRYAQQAGNLFRSSPIIAQVIETLENDPSELVDAPASKETLYEQLYTVRKILGDNADAHNFNVFLYELARTIVEATRRGVLFGMGRRDMPEEDAFLADFKKRLNV